MVETELKFQVPAARWAALRQAVATTTATRTRLQALYAETAGHDLAAAGLALRLRKEGRVWVQTLKGRGDGLMQRLEHEVRLPPQRGQAALDPAHRGLPALDPARHDGTPAGLALRAALAAARQAGRSDELRTLYRTDIQRLHRRVRHAGAVVEIALDQGTIHAEGLPGQPPRRLPVAEIEFELISGPAPALTALAERWALRFGLWWDVRTKSERGFRLALDRQRVPAVLATPAALPAGDALAPGPALAAMLQSALAQALPNLAEIAGAPADAPAAPEHLHQLRVALRRLRTALALFGAWSGDEDRALALEARWRDVFTALGSARDADVLATVWLPRLQAAGAPARALLADAGTVQATQMLAPDGLARDPTVTVLLLQTLGWAMQLAQGPVAAVGSAGASLGASAAASTAPSTAAPSSPSASASASAAAAAASIAASTATAARAVLRQAWRRAWADARHFATAPLAQQHRARKRLKRLRYALEFVAPLLPARRLRRHQQALARALKALGEHNDLQTARAYFMALAAQRPEAWFAVGWLAAQDAAARQRAQRSLTALAAKSRPWKR